MEFPERLRKGCAGYFLLFIYSSGLFVLTLLLFVCLLFVSFDFFLSFFFFKDIQLKMKFKDDSRVGTNVSLLSKSLLTHPRNLSSFP